MKRIFVLLSLCAVFYVTLTAQITPVAPPGAGSESNPYRIESIDNLYWISQNQSQWSKNYIQTVDIDASDTVGLNGGAGWTPIGYYTTRVSVPFTGVYDGQGHTIENLYINAPGTNRSVGLFGYTLGASIERLGLTTYNITGNNRVGSLVGFNLSSIIQDCFSNGEIAGYSDVGGLVGWNDNSTISNSYSISNVTRTSGTEPFFGIFVGYNYNSTIQYSYTGGNVFYTGFVDPTNKGFVGDEESPTRQPRSTNTYQSNFFDNQSSNQETAIGAAAYDTAAMQTRDLYLGEGWDFVYTWALDGVLNGGYPYKLWQEVDAVHPSGSGTEVRPYVINTLSHLFWIAQNPKEWDKHYIQKMNIDATATVNWFGGYGWVPIGSTETNFTGSYNGMGYRIVNLSLNRPETDNVGLFGVTEDSRIKNIGIISPVISGKDQTGTIVGNNSRTDLNNCYIEGGTVNGVQRTGGLIGKNYRSEISYCFTSAIVNGQHFTGGLIGLNDESNIVNSYNSGDVTAAGNDIGGLVGRNYESYLHESYNSGHLNASGSGNRVGGLIGSNYLSLIVNCYNVGNVTLGITDVGGLIGRNYQSTINKSYSKGLVTGSGTGVGGLVGYQIGSSVVESYWDTQTSVQTESAGGEGRITEDMTCPYNFTNTYLNWDFDEIWYLCQTTNEGYPYFRWQSSPRNLVAVEGYGEVTLYWQEPVTMTRQSFSEFSESSDHFFSRTSFLGYNIYRDGSLLEELFPDLVYTDSDVGNDIAYQYYVTAVYEDDVESAPSNVVEATPFSLNVPGNLRATVGDHLVFLEWDEPLPQSVDLIFYRLYRDDTVLAITVDQHYYDNDVVNNQTYQYKVSAVYIVNGVETESEPSNIVEATPYIPPPAYAQSPLPEDGVEMVMVDTQFGWTYTTDPFFSDPIGYKVRAGTDPDLTSYQEVYVAGGPGTYLIDAFLGMDHDETYYWQVIPTTDPETRQSTTRNTGRSGQRDSRSRADAEDCPVWSFTTIAQYTMTISIEGSGTTNPAAGAYQYLDGTMVDIEAFPDPGWDFVKWVIDGVDFTNTLETVTIEGDVEAVAHFIELFSLTVNDPVGLGSVKIDDVDVVTPYVDILEDGTNVTLLAEPDPDWAFVKWVINGVEIFEAETDVTMTEDVTATPHFIELFTLTINDPVGEGAVKVDDVEVVTPYVDILEDGTIVTLLAEPDPDWAFVKWVVNGVEIFDAETDVAMTENVTATPHFIELFTLTINDPVGDGAVKVDDVEVVTPYVDILEDGTIVTLLAEPDPDWAFVKWVVNGVEIFDAETDVTMTENVTATPHFIELFTLTVNDPVGEGAVKVDGIDIVTPYVDILEDGTIVTLLAEPDPDWAFVKWVINGVEIFDAETDVTMTENVTATPHFIELFTLTVNDPVGDGAVKVDDVEVVTPYVDILEDGTIVTLLAEPEPDWAFVKWVVNGVEIFDAETDVTMTENVTAAPHFIELFTLTVNEPVGEGAVKVDGVEVVTPYVDILEDGTIVTLLAEPEPDWAFVKWVVNGVDIFDAEIDVTMTENVTATPHLIELFTLTVNDPVGDGAVKVDGVEVVTPYVDILEDGTIVTLLAEPELDWAFVKWIVNGVEIFDAETDVTMTENVTATPHFIELFTLTVNEPVGNGAVKVDGIDIVTPYVDILEDGTVVTLLAEPDPDWAFVKWVVNGVEIFDAETDVTMTENVTAAPHFILLPKPAAFIYPPDNGSDIPINFTFEWEPVTSGANPDGYLFSYWLAGEAQPEMNDLGNNTVFVVENLDYDTAYHWQVIPYIQGENGERKLLMEPGVKNIIRESDYYYPEEDCPIWSFTTIAEFSLIITIQGSGITSPVEGEHIYLAGTSVNIEAFPYPGWEFEKWIINDALEIYDISTDILMDGNKAITARFQQDPPVTSAPVWGDGSELDPYHVENLNHLYWIAEDSDRWLYHYIQVADIDASATKHWFEGEGWLPIGNPVTPFTGTFDGQNYSIEWLVIDRPSSDHIGLFGYADNSTITNVGLFNSEITGKDYVGSLVGSLVNDSSVSNCFSTGIVTGNDFVGGLLGENNLSVIDNSYSRCEVTGNQYVGGLIGNNHQGSVIHCYSIGFVQGIDQAGGLVGVKTIGGLYTDTNNYWNTETSEIDLSAMGEGRTTNEMTHPHSANTYLDWDFVNLWISEADANNGYPYLFWQDIEGTVVPGGDITELYWTLDNSPYYITEQIMVNADAILYIEEGVEVVFYPGTSLTVWGGLEAQGVLFNSAGTHGSWNGLRFTGNSYGIMIDNCTIINAIPAIVAEDAEGFVTNSLISKNENVFSNQDIAVLIHNYCDIDFSGLQIENYHVGIRYLVDDEEPSRLTTSFSELVIKNRISPLHSDEPVGIHLIEAPVTLLDNIIIYIIGHLSSRVSGNAVVLNGVDDLTIINNTVWGYETGLYARNSSGIMYSNNIIWVENGEIDGLLNPIDIDFENNITVSNCLISYFAGRQNNDTYPGSNNLNVDPKFVDPWNGDFHLRYRSPIKGINIGALGFVFEHLANSYHSFPLRNGWNLIGIPALIYGDNTPATPHEIFSDYLDPFFVHPYYTSIVQMNQIPDATINDQGNYALNFDGAYHAPSNIFPMMGYWVRNYGDPTTVEVYGLIDTDDYLISLPGQGNTSNGWYLLANPYDKPISWGNGIDWENDGEASFVYVHRYNPVYNGYQYLPIEGDAQIAPWEGFFVKSNQPDSEIRFSYPDSFDRDNSAMINNSVTRNSMKRRSHDNSDTSDNNTEWLITLSANHQSNTDVTVVSARANASEDLDGYDVPKLPRAPFVMTNSLIFGIDNRDWNDAPGLYTRDTRSLANDNWSWDILLDVSGLKQGVEIDDYLVTIVLDEMINVPDGYQFSLTNQLTGEIVDPTRDEMIIDLYELLVPQLTSSTRGSERSRDNQDLHIYLQLNISSTNLESEENLSTPVPVIALTNYPNPFNPETRIRYSIGKDTFVKVEVFNIKGQLVKTLVNEFTAAGNHSVTWNGTDDNNNRTSSGIYLYRMTAGKEMITSKMLMIK